MRIKRMGKRAKAKEITPIKETAKVETPIPTPVEVSLGVESTVETPKPPAIPITPVTKVKEKRPRAIFNFKKILLIIVALVGIGFSFYLGSIWLADPQQTITGMLTVMIFGGSGIILFLAFKREGGLISTSQPLRYGQEKPKYKGPPNCINVYGKVDPKKPGHILPERIEFAHEDNPPGMRRKLRNDGKFYYLNMHDTTVLKDVVLPDNQYCDPRRFLIPVIMKYSRDYYTPVPSLFQKIKPLLFLALIGIGALILVITAPTPGG
jgi:hypothetical protein